jgi:hypothetical protein
VPERATIFSYTPETWTASTTASQWRADGSISLGGSSRSAFLPFVPASGKVYAYSLDINATNTGGDWLGMGFAKTANTASDFSNAAINAAPWMFEQGFVSPGQVTGTFLGPNTTSGAFPSSTDGTHNFKIVLDTRPALWTATWYEDNSVIRGPTPYTTNPTINHIGISRFATATGSVDNLLLLELGPEIAVSGNSVDIVDGDLTPSLSDFTDFGTTTVGSPFQRTFRVDNSGDIALTTSGLSLPTGFSLVEGLSSSIAVGGFDTFTVQLDALTAGTYSGSISFTNNDPDETPFNFAITGTVVPEPGSFAMIAAGIISMLLFRKQRLTPHPRPTQHPARRS